MSELTEKIDHALLEDGVHYYIKGTGIGVAVDVDGEFEIRYAYGVVYDPSKFTIYTVPSLNELLGDDE